MITPIVTVGLIVANALVWAVVQGFGMGEPLVRSVCNLGLIPAEVLQTVKPGTGIELAPGMSCLVDASPSYHTVLTSMFLHGGWLHIIGNLLFLWVFGNNIEDAMGHVRFVVFYLLCGVAAAAAQVAVSPNSLVPMVGASGAISGVLGGYLLLYPRARVHTLVPLGFFITTIELPAFAVLGLWIVMQLVNGLPTLAGLESGSGVAFWAHVGGFVAGLVLIKLFAKSEFLARRPVVVRERRRRGWDWN